MKRIGLADLAAEYRERGAALAACVEQVARSGQFILGPAVASFEQALARTCGLAYAVGVGCGTDALLLGLRAVGVGAGDLVVTTPLSFVATAEAIVRCGARPCFVDVEPDTLCLDPQAVARLLDRCVRDGSGALRLGAAGERMAALLPVHLFGRVAAVDELGRLARGAGVPLVEDAAQAVGARGGHGPLGRAGPVCLSFFPTKNLGGWGDGGAVLSDDQALADRVRALRVHGWDGKGRFAALGMNSRLDALQAAVLETKLGWLAEYDGRRRRHAERYRRLLGEVEGLAGLRLPPPFAETDVVHQFTIRLRSSLRAGLRQHLAQAEVDTAVYYSRLLCDQPAIGPSCLIADDLGRARAASDEVLSLPVHPQLDDADVDRVARAVAEFVVGRRGATGTG